MVLMNSLFIKIITNTIYLLLSIFTSDIHCDLGILDSVKRAGYDGLYLQYEPGRSQVKGQTGLYIEFRITIT